MVCVVYSVANTKLVYDIRIFQLPADLMLQVEVLSAVIVDGQSVELSCTANLPSADLVGNTVVWTSRTNQELGR